MGQDIMTLVPAETDGTLGGRGSVSRLLFWLLTLSLYGWGERIII